MMVDKQGRRFPGGPADCQKKVSLRFAPRLAAKSGQFDTPLRAKCFFRRTPNGSPLGGHAAEKSELNAFTALVFFRKKQHIFCIVLAFFNSNRYNKLVKVSVPALEGRAGTENKRK